MLVVIAIIAILAAILFPVFARAREKARQTTCMSNQRQIVTSVLMYAQDHEEMLPEVSSVWKNINIDPQIRVCPTAGKSNMDPYLYGYKCGGKALGEILAPELTWMTADGLAFSYDYRHSNKCILSYVDGHVATVSSPPPILVAPNTVTGNAWNGRITRHIIDGSGLSASITPNVEPPTNKWPSHGITPDNDAWLVSSTSSTPLVFDLGGAYTITGCHVWNYNKSGYTYRGAKDVTISMSEDGITYNDVLSTTFQQASGQSSYTGQTVTWPASTGGFVRFTIANNMNGSTTDMWGMSEVRFIGVERIAPDCLIVKPTSATSTPAYGNRGALFCINGTGLSFPLSTGDTMPTQWPACPGGGDNWQCLLWINQGNQITFDMGSSYNLAGFHLWNANEGVYANRGVKRVSITVSNDNSTWTSVAIKPNTCGQASGQTSYQGEDHYFENVTSARYVRMTINSNWGDGSFYGLEEIRFMSLRP